MNPEPSGEPRAWVTLDEAAQELRLSQQSLWHRLQEQRIQVLRVEHDGRRVSALSRDDLERLAGTNGEARPAPAQPEAPQPAPRAIEPAPQPVGTEPPAGPRSLWQQLREIEVQRDQLGFELHILRVQLGDTRVRAQQAEESLRLLRGDLECARAEAEHLRERVEPLEAEHARQASSLEIERERRASAERQLAKLIEVEEARERYCDRLEERLYALRRFARGA